MREQDWGLDLDVGCGSTDEGYLDKLIDAAMVMVGRLEDMWSAAVSGALAKKSDVIGPNEVVMG